MTAADQAAPAGIPDAYFDPVHREAKRLLSGAQLQVFNALVELSGIGLEPVEATNAEIGERINRHEGTVRLHLHAIEAAGLIRREEVKGYRINRRIHFTFSFPRGKRPDGARAIPPEKRAPSLPGSARHPPREARAIGRATRCRISPFGARPSLFEIV